VVAVEDVFSALRLWQAGVNAVSLLGTSLTPTKMAELRRNAGTIVLVLDADAAGRAIDSALRFSIHVRALMGADIKDMTEEQLRLWIASLTSSLPASSLEPPLI
jgi:DNA primase